MVTDVTDTKLAQIYLQGSGAIRVLLYFHYKPVNRILISFAVSKEIDKRDNINIIFSN